MAAEEFVLIPRTVYIREQPEIVQILEDPNVKNKATHISMLQRDSNSKPQEEQNNFLELEQSSNILEKILSELKSLPKIKLQRAETILKKILASNKFTLDKNLNLVFNGTATNIPAASFLYNLSQPTKVINKVVYSQLISELNLGNHLVLNKHARDIIEQIRLGKVATFEKPEVSSDDEELSFKTPEKTIPYWKTYHLPSKIFEQAVHSKPGGIRKRPKP